MKLHQIRLLFVATFFLALTLLPGSFSSTLAAQEHEKEAAPDEATRLKLNTERVVVFKDGYCLVIKKGIAKTDKNGATFTDEVPDAAVLGSFWAIAQEGTIRSMTAGWVEEQEESVRERNCEQTIDVIRANVGSNCSFVVDTDRKLSGKISTVLTEPKDTPRNPALTEASRFLSSNSRFITAPIVSSMTDVQQVGTKFVLSTDTGDMLIDANAIRQLTIDDMKTRIEQKSVRKSKRKRLTLRFAEPITEVAITLIYFRPGVRWIPTYRVDLAEDDKNADAKKKFADISLQGELINEAEDLIDMPIDVVVGVPNFRFRDVPSPLVLEGVMRNALANGNAGFDSNSIRNQSFSNAMYTQRASEFRSARATGGEPGSDLNLPEDLTGSAGNDLFVYSLPKMTLKKGERATVPIMNTKVPYRDIFTWDVQLKHTESYVASGSAANSPLVLSENTVWRQVELINDTKFPWTTGAAMFVEGFQPLAQELLTYTSPGGICRVPVTVAVDLRGKAVDQEVDRKLEDMKWRGYDYARVKGRAEMELANNKDVAVPVEVRLTFGGKAGKMSDDGKLRLSPFRAEDWDNYSGERAVNNSSNIVWKSTIEPGECFKPTVDYHFFVRH